MEESKRAPARNERWDGGFRLHPTFIIRAQVIRGPDQYGLKPGLPYRTICICCQMGIP